MRVLSKSAQIYRHSLNAFAFSCTSTPLHTALECQASTLQLFFQLRDLALSSGDCLFLLGTIPLLLSLPFSNLRILSMDHCFIGIFVLQTDVSFLKATYGRGHTEWTGKTCSNFSFHIWFAISSATRCFCLSFRASHCKTTVNSPNDASTLANAHLSSAEPQLTRRFLCMDLLESVFFILPLIKKPETVLC